MLKFEKFWELYNAVSDPETADGWVEGFAFGLEMNAACEEIAAFERADAEISDELDLSQYASEDDDSDEAYLGIRSLEQLVRENDDLAQ